MTTVEIDVLPSGSITGFYASGHAGYGETGSDIVCAAVSALTLTAANALHEIAGLFVGIDLSEDSGDLSVTLEKKLTRRERSKADIILMTMRLGLLSLAKDYPDHLKIVERRCN